MSADVSIAVLRRSAAEIIRARRCYLDARHAIHHGMGVMAIIFVPRGMAAMARAATLLGVPVGEQGEFDKARCIDVAERIVARRGPCGANDEEISHAAEQLVGEAEAFLRGPARRAV